MKKLIVAVLLLSGCVTHAELNTNSNENRAWVLESVKSRVSEFSPKPGIVCYVTDGSYSGGISCIHNLSQ